MDTGGYFEGLSINDMTHTIRSAGLGASNVGVSSCMVLQGRKELFLSNVTNKQIYINLLIETKNDFLLGVIKL